jgi:hypothetical protein
MIYVYAIVDRPEVPVQQGIRGLEDAPVHLIGCRDIGATVSPLSTSNVPTTEANLWRHEAVMDALMADRTLLPVRFGTILADEGSVQNVLSAHHESFVARLGRVRGHVELALRVCWDEVGESNTESTTGAISGREYMTARLKEYRTQQRRRERAEECAGIVHSALSSLATQSARRLLPTPQVLMTSAYLVRSGDVADFQRELEGLRVSHPELRFLCTGPWPPFTFVAEEECDNGDINSRSDAFAVGLGQLG